MKFLSENNLAALLGISSATVKSWARKGLYPSIEDSNGIPGFNMEDLSDIPEITAMLDSKWEEEMDVTPLRCYNSVELFAGGGGLALGMEKSGFHHVLLNEFDTSACNTLKANRPDWNVIEGDIRHIDFSSLKGKIDFLSGGFPCQAFSFAGKQGGFNDVRGTLFFELARAVKEIQPRVFMAENVKGIVSHDEGRTFATICNVIDELGYSLIPPKVLKAIMYQVPQKRERIIFIAIRKDLVDGVEFKWPSPYKYVLTLRDAFYKSELYSSDVPYSEGVSYPARKKKILEMVPPGGDWRNLPEEVAKEYMGGSWNLGGGKTGMARRLSLDEPSLTLTCAPAQKQTERCHPIETRPLSVREYARIQTFPDDWIFQGTISDRYKQIGNAVPVNLAWSVGRSIVRLMNSIEVRYPKETEDCTDEVNHIISNQAKLVVTKNKRNQTSEIDKRCHQLDIFSLLEETKDNDYVVALGEDLISYGDETKFRIIDDNEKSTNALIALIPPSLKECFEQKQGEYYFTGRNFPASVSLSKLRYLIPYIKGRGIKDVYAISRIKIGTREGNLPKKNSKDLRLNFELKFIGSLFEDYKKCNLKIWNTFNVVDIVQDKI